MAKKVVATLKTAGGTKTLTRCIKMVKSDKTIGFVFKTAMVPNEEVKQFFEDKK